MDSVECEPEDVPEGIDYDFDPDLEQAKYADIVANSSGFVTLPVDLEWRNLELSVPIKRNKSQMKVVLHPMSGHVRSGHMLAIMGPSGAGKTSLCNLLAGRVIDSKGLSANGEVFVNGRPRNHAEFRHYASYVVQHDDMFADLTVAEQIGYAATLRLPSTMPAEEKKDRVDRLIQQLGLAKVKESRIGGKIVRGISGGERKRVAIATELVTDPSLLFLDEPTTGLDANAALKVMQNLRVIASSGRTVVTTIHQPRSSIFQLFDQLLLLSEGHVMFFGNAKDAVPYFAALSFRAPRHFNPSDYFLDILSVDPRSPELEKRTRKRIKFFQIKYEDVLNSNGDSSDIEANGNENGVGGVDNGGGGNTSKQPMKEKRESSNQKGDDVTVKRLWGKYRNPWLKELAVLCNRAFKLASRERTTKKARLFVTLFMGFTLGLIWLNNGRESGLPTRRSLVGILFFICVNIVFDGIGGAMFQFPIERNVLTRERAATMYRTSAYYISRSVLDMLTTLSFNSLSAIIIYSTVGFRPDVGSFFRFLLVLFLVSTFAESLALTLAITFDSVEAGLSQVRLTVIVFILFGGFFIEQALLPSWLAWIRYISFVYYGFSALTQIEFPSDSNDPMNQAVRLEFGLSTASYWVNIAALAGLIFFTKFIGFLVLEYVRAPRFFKF